jgi:hypothetical protein
MPQNNNDHWGIRRIGAITAVSLTIFLTATAPLYGRDLPVLAISTWAILAGWGGFTIALWLCKPDWRCRLPAGLRALFHRSLEHPWRETRRVGDYVEEQCPRCLQFHHGRMRRDDSAEWVAGPLLAERGDQIVPRR